MANSIDLSKLTPRELKNLLVNNHRAGRASIVIKIVKEMNHRNIATKGEFQMLAWNQDQVRKDMHQFKEVASAVKGNRGTPYTEGGGRRRLRRGHPDKLWIDTYSSIRTPKINAEFLCYMKEPGDDPEFHLTIDHARVQTFNADALSEALRSWRKVADRA
jgi:hypothetical protein